VLVTNEGVVVVDTIEPKSARWLKNELARRFDQSVKYVVFSHSHYDHIGGTNLFSDDGAIVIAQENATAEILEEERMQQWMSKRNIALPDVAFNDRFIIKIGGKTINLISLGTGHTDSLIAMQDFNYLKRWDEWFLFNVAGVYVQIADGTAGD